MSDLKMPGMDGLELLRRIRKLAGALLPAIAVTGDPAWAYRNPMFAISAGYDHHLVKPVMPRELIAVLATMLPR